MMRCVGFAMIVSLIGAGAAHGQSIPASAGGDHPRERQEYLMQQRAYPFDRVPPGALMRARMAAMRSPRVGSFGAALSNMGPWTLIGPAPINTVPLNAGRVSAIAVDPTNSNIVYVGAAQGGVWKTTDGGASWTPLTDNQCSLAIGSITIDPRNPAIVYAGTGEENFSGDSYYGCGILRTTDGGATWTTLGQNSFLSGNGGGAQIGKILIDPATAGSTSATLYAATSFGVYRSLNGGTSWLQVLSKGFGYATDIVAPVIPGSPLFAAETSPFTNATPGSQGIYKSLDAGTTWTLVGGGLPTTSVGRIALSVSPANANVMYAAIEDPVSGNLQGLYRTADGGTTWTSMGAGGQLNCSTQCWYAMTVTPSPTDPATVFFGGLSLYKSIDFGATFSNIPGLPVHVDHHVLTFDPSNPLVVYAGTDGGVYRSSDAGATWVSLNNGLAITQFYGGLSVNPTGAFPVIGGTQDNGTLQYNGVPAWSAIIGGDGGFTAINPLTPTTSYGETQWTQNSFGGPLRRTTSNGSFLAASTGISLADFAQFIPPIAIDPVHPNFLYFGTSRLYRTKNGGDLWAAISPNLNGTLGITAIGVAPSDTLVLYVGIGGQVQVSTNGGVTWTLASTGLPNRSITDFSVNAAQSNIAYVTVSGFATGHVFKTTNRGTSWTNITGNLPNVPVNAIVAVPGGELFVGTDLGVYRSGDDGATWSVASTGLPNVAVFDLTYSLATQTLYAATHGRSVWTASVPASLIATQLAVIAGATATQTGTVLSPQPVVRIAEVTGITVPTASNVVTATLTAGGGSLSGTTSVTAVSGVATFTNLAVAGQGAQTITFSSGGLTTATLTVNVAVATTIAVAPTSRRDTVTFGATTAHNDSATVTLAGDNALTTIWTATKLKPQTTLTTASATGTGKVRWSRNPTGLAIGIFVDTITITAAAGGSPQRVIDSLVVISPPAAVALLTPTAATGAKNDAAVLDLSLDLTGIPGTLLGTYAVDVTWNSNIVVLDSTKAITGGFTAPTVALLGAQGVHLTATSGTGKAGAFGLARLYLRFVSDTNGQSNVIPLFTTLTSTTATNLLPTLTVKTATASQIGVLRGDVNGDGVVTVADAQLVLQAVVGLPLTAPAKGLPNGDANCNGKLEAVDAQIILAYVLGLPVSQFCVNKVR